MAREFSEVVKQWHSITPHPDELRETLSEFPVRLSRLMPDCAGRADEGTIWLDAGLVGDPDVSSHSLLALYLHEVTHAKLQRLGLPAGHTAEFAKLSWALASRHGVRDWCDEGYDMHETSAWESSEITEQRWRNARAGSVALAKSDDPICEFERRFHESRAGFYLIFFLLLVAVVISLFVVVIGKAGLLPGVCDAWQHLQGNPLTRFLAGAIVMAGALWWAFR